MRRGKSPAEGDDDTIGSFRIGGSTQIRRRRAAVNTGYLEGLLRDREIRLQCARCSLPIPVMVAVAFTCLNVVSCMRPCSR